MKKTNFFPLLLAINLVIVGLIATNIKKVQADVFCPPVEDDCNQDGTIESNLEYYKVNIRNQTNRKIWVAVHYQRENSWITNGYWALDPGETSFILGGRQNRIQNRYIYFHAHDQAGNVWGNNPYSWEVNGTLQPFFQTNMGGEIREFTQNFTLN